MSLMAALKMLEMNSGRADAWQIESNYRSFQRISPPVPKERNYKHSFSCFKLIGESSPLSVAHV